MGQSINDMINFSNALDSLQHLRGAAQKAGDAQITQGLLDLQGELLGLQVQMLEQQVDARMFQDEAVRLRGLLSTARRLERVNDVYYLLQANGEEFGPYCKFCWDRREMLQTLVDAGEGAGYCPNCKQRKETRHPNSQMETAA